MQYVGNPLENVCIVTTQWCLDANIDPKIVPVVMAEGAIGVQVNARLDTATVSSVV